MAGKGVVRSIKNYAKGFSDVQIKVRKATSNDAWGPSGTLMNEIAQLTYNKHEFIEVMDMIDKRLNDKGKNWRHVFKALLLLDYCLHVGSENVIVYARENSYVVKTLRDFQHIDETGKDVGANVRQKAKDIINLLQDDHRLQEERRQRKKMRQRMAGVGDYINEVSGEGSGERHGGGGDDEDDDELHRALEESKRLADEEERKRRQGEDEALNQALQLSEQEANKQPKTSSSDFDAIFAPQPQPEPQAAPLQIAWPAQQQPDAAFFQTPPTTNNPYMQSSQQLVSMQPTGFAPPSSAFFAQDHAQQQQMQQQQSQQAANMSPFTAFGNSMMPSQQQAAPSPFSSFSQAATQPFGASAFDTSAPSPFNSHSPFQQQQSSSPMAGSRNPFGQSASPQPDHASIQQIQQQQQQQQQPQPSTFELFAASLETNKHTLQQQAAASTATTATRSIPSSPQVFPASSPFSTSTTTAAESSITANMTSKPMEDPRYAKLNSLLANRDDGLDTFGNTGALRVPVGTGFANSIKEDTNMVAQAADSHQHRSEFDEAFGISTSPATNPKAQNPFQSNSPFAPLTTPSSFL
ncbi:hypothetical protein BC940DRAFT_309257 [Gongronella butleri]|nr:hypothetical protein BC940DRAFT_309257 [Gongronella butleri]